VLGRREVAGRSGTILEGEAGANDPVGIALMASLLTAGPALGLGAVGGIADELLQLAVGGVVGVAGGALLVRFMRRVPLPSEGLYPLRVLAGGLVIYGAATVAHGSGFLAVFIAGILLGDARAPYKGEVERFHGALASLAEIVAFLVLGLTVGLHTLPHAGGLWIGLGLAVLLTLVVRPLLVGLLLVPVRLAWGERLFVLWAGLKGAVPILLGSFLLTTGVPDASRLYAVIVWWWPSRSSSRAASCLPWPPGRAYRCGPWNPSLWVPDIEVHVMRPAHTHGSAHPTDLVA